MSTISDANVARPLPVRGPHSKFVGSSAPAAAISPAVGNGLRFDWPALPNRPLNVLLVDDLKADVDSWLAMLEQRFGGGARTHVALTAAEALRILAREPIDVVLTEYRLPDADGLGLVASIAARYPAVATIVVTSYGNETIAANALKFGARDYLATSALDAAALQRSIVQAMGKASLEREQIRRLAQLEHSHIEMDQIVRTLSHDMTAMFMLLDHSFQRLKDVAEPKTALKKPIAEQSTEDGGSAIAPLAQQFAHVEACLRESKRFLDDLTTVARTGQVRMEPSRVELSAAVAEVLFEQRELLAERNVQLDVSVDLPAVWCNPCRVKQVITNLVRNAVRHGCDLQKPTISISRRDVSDAEVDMFEWIAVHDNGPGIPAAMREEIFEPGRRLPDAHPDGSGMGLAIVRKIVNYYGGRVYVDPNGNGTTFIFSLPQAIN